MHCLNWTFLDRSLAGSAGGLILIAGACVIFVKPLAQVLYFGVTGQLRPSQLVSSLPGLLIAAMIAVPLILTGWWLAAGRVKFRADAADQQLVQSTNLLFFKRDRVYRFSEFQSVQVEEETRRGTINRSYITVSVVSPNVSVVVRSEPSIRAEDCAAFGRELAGLMGITYRPKATGRSESQTQPVSRLGRAISEALSWLL